MATKEYSLSEVFAEHYLGIGAIGRHVITNILDDVRTGAVTETVNDIGDSETDALEALADIIVSVIQGGHLHDIRTPNGWQAWETDTDTDI